MAFPLDQSGVNNPCYKHGRSYDAEYRAWKRIRQRCFNPNYHSFADYGGRGILVCTRWEDPTAFLADMGPMPSPQHSIERIDNDGPYSPENCRWALPKEQASNRRTTVLLTHNGETKTMAEWSRITGIGKTTLSNRLKAGWSHEGALTTPPDRANKKR